MKKRTGETYQGKPCSRGHDGLRYDSSGACVQCMKEASARQRERRLQKSTRKKPAKPKKAGRPGASFRKYPDPAEQPAMVAKISKTRMKVVKQRPADLDGVETVEQFLARGGQIQEIAVGVGRGSGEEVELTD